GAIRVVLGRVRSLGVADSSLRSLGPERISMVLDSGWTMGACVGVVGERARICRLVSAWIWWSCRCEPQRRLPRWRLDGGARASVHAERGRLAVCRRRSVARRALVARRPYDSACTETLAGQRDAAGFGH